MLVTRKKLLETCVCGGEGVWGEKKKFRPIQARTTVKMKTKVELLKIRAR